MVAHKALIIVSVASQKCLNKRTSELFNTFVNNKAEALAAPAVNDADHSQKVLKYRLPAVSSAQL